MMTKLEVLKEARRHLGPTAYAEQVAVRSDLAYQVGVIEDGIKRVRGTGKSWEEAIELADRLEDLVRRGIR